MSCGFFYRHQEGGIKSSRTALEKCFYQDMNTKHWYDEGGDKSLSPHTAPELGDDDVVPVQGL